MSDGNSSNDFCGVGARWVGWLLDAILGPRLAQGCARHDGNDEDIQARTVYPGNPTTYSENDRWLANLDELLTDPRNYDYENAGRAIRRRDRIVAGIKNRIVIPGYRLIMRIAAGRGE